MPDEQNSNTADEKARLLAQMDDALAGNELEESAEKPSPSPGSGSTEREMPPAVRSFFAVAGSLFAAGCVVFGLFVYPGWHRILEMIEFLFRWAGDAP
jgi:hypothetical protein